MNETKNIYVPITKRDEEKRIVWGYASTADLDWDGERMDMASLKAALPDYMRFANVREMHQLSAVGKTVEAEFDDKGLYIGAHIVDDAAWKKVKAGVYNGFSVGVEARKKLKVLYTKKLGEISVVDRPSNPSSVFEVWKADGAPTLEGDEMSDELKEVVQKLEGIADGIGDTVNKALSPVVERLGKVEADLARLSKGTPPAPKAGDGDGESETVLKMQAQIDEMQAAAEKREKADHEVNRKKVLDAAISAGKFLPKDRKQWEKDFDANPGMVERILKSAPAVVPIGERKGASGTGEDKSADEQFNDLADAETQKIMDREKCDEGTAYMKAVNKIAKMHPELYRQRTEESLHNAAKVMSPFGMPGSLPGE